MTTNKTSDSAFRITFSTSDSSPLDFDYTVNWLINAVLVWSRSWTFDQPAFATDSESTFVLWFDRLTSVPDPIVTGSPCGTADRL